MNTVTTMLLLKWKLWFLYVRPSASSSYELLLFERCKGHNVTTFVTGTNTLCESTRQQHRSKEDLTEALEAAVKASANDWRTLRCTSFWWFRFIYRQQSLNALRQCVLKMTNSLKLGGHNCTHLRLAWKCSDLSLLVKWQTRLVPYTTDDAAEGSWMQSKQCYLPHRDLRRNDNSRVYANVPTCS